MPRRLDHEMVMVGHLAVGVTTPVEALANLLKQDKSGLAVLIVPVNSLAAISPRSNVIEAAGKLKAKWSGHALKHSL